MKYLTLIILLTFSGCQAPIEPIEHCPPPYPTVDVLKAPVEKSVKPQESFRKEDTWSEHTCLTLNIYWESKGESERGRILVAQTTLNRVNSDKSYFPNTICQVVRQRTGKRCAFSWMCDGKSDVPVELEQYEKAKIIADKALKGGYTGVTKALYFKKCTIVSRFFGKLKYLGREGNHCFFNEH